MAFDLVFSKVWYNQPLLPARGVQRPVHPILSIGARKGPLYSEKIVMKNYKKSWKEKKRKKRKKVKKSIIPKKQNLFLYLGVLGYLYFLVSGPL